MKAEVFFSKQLDINAAFDALKIDFIKEKSMVALKIHFGEIGNKAYLKPDRIKPLIKRVVEMKALPFLTDANTLYKGTRGDAVSHSLTAYEHGYNYENVGIPVIIADGLRGIDHIAVPVNLKHFKDVKIAAAAYQADSIIVLTHFKGHELTGFGGSLKNIGMGLGSRPGKQTMHAEVTPEPDMLKCTGCGTCEKWCPVGAITMVNGKAVIDRVKCIGCAECVAMCTSGAISISWSGSAKAVQEKIAEYCFGVMKDKKGKMAYFNFLTDISPNCDCYPYNDAPITDDIGLLASTDPVAVDQASVDLVNKASNSKDKFREVYPDIDWSVQLSYAQNLGLGSREYELKEI